MRIFSYNVNGIRSAISKGLLNWVESEMPDVLCFQEIKADMSTIPVETFNALGYHCFFYPAQKKGYSGVGVITKIKPIKVKYGCSHQLFDHEGRVVTLFYNSFTLINAYFPSGSSGEERQNVKMDFLSHITSFIETIKMESPNLIICGDFNICHQPIDIHDPVRNASSSGFLPEERAWFSNFLSLGYTDTFRALNLNTKHFYSWWSFRANARANNKGWRIDYLICSNELFKHVTNAHILMDVKHADHCPVFVELMID